MRHALLAVVIAGVASMGCGGSDEPKDPRLQRYLDGAEPAMTSLFRALEGLRGGPQAQESLAEAVDRVEVVAQGYERSQREMAELDPPPELRDEHAGLLDSLEVTAREYARLAVAMARGPEALDRLEQSGLDRAGVQLRAWARATQDSARRAGSDVPAWLDGLSQEPWNDEGRPEGRPS